MTHSPSRQCGFTLVGTIFLITVLALLGGYMLRMSAVQHTSSGLSSQGIRAHFAALSGMEWAMAEATRSQVSHDAICGSPATSTGPFTLSVGVLNGFAVTVVCDDGGGFQEGGTFYEVDNITVTATKGSGGDTAARTLRATITRGEALP